MTLQPAAPTSFRLLRALSNIVAFVVLLVALDWGLSWWRGTPTYSCAVLQAAVSEHSMEAVGILGLLTVMLGVMFGGARHWLTGLGAAVMVLGLLGTILAAEPVARL